MSIFSNLFNLIKKWFKPNKALPAPININEELNETAPVSSEDRDIFVNEIKVKKHEESQELLELQSKFESNQIQLTDLTDEELDNLNSLYQRQIDELKEKVNKTKSEININMNKLESTSLSA
ncbi:MAG: hypothetical protein IKF17_05540 [Clostridia bacterium]|nr:hypothetical protein [Clostridia bacterium]